MALDRPEQPFYFIKVSPIELINKSRQKPKQKLSGLHGNNRQAEVS